MDHNNVNENCSTVVQETLTSHQTITQIEQISIRHYGQYNAAATQHEHRSTLSHSYDPNMCTTAARFSESFYSGSTVACASAMAAEQAPTTAANDEDLLCYNNIILLHETAEIGAEAIVGSANAFKDAATTTVVPTATTTANAPVTLQTQIQVEEVSKYQYTSHENAQAAGVLVHRLPYGHLYQNYQNYLLNTHTTEVAKDAVEFVQIAGHSHHNDVHMFDGHNAADVESATHMPSFELPSSHYPYQQDAPVVDDSSVDLMAQYAADLTNVSTVEEHYASHRERDEQRTLLDTMSPLLAAVNDITKRDAELQSYLNQHIERESTLSTNYLEKENNNYVLKSKNAATDNSSDEDDYRRYRNSGVGMKFLVSDKPVQSRAKASLPTNYLFFGHIDSKTNEPAVYAKKAIPCRTKFGPFEGETHFASEIDLDVLHVQTPRYYPLLILDDSHILHVANEETSNWMRYVRLAQTFEQQNLQLLLEDGKIYFKCIRNIRVKQELRVGYSNTYAARFYLPTLQPTTEDLQADFEHQNPWKCFECAERFATVTAMNIHLKVHDDEDEDGADNEEEERLRSIARKRNLRLKKRQAAAKRLMPKDSSLRCKVCFKYFMTKDSLKKHLTRQHTTLGVDVAVKRKLVKRKIFASDEKKKLRKYMYKCNLCAKRFHNEARLMKHKNTQHDTNLQKPHMCHICQQQCATPAALTAHEQSHSSSQYACVFCEQKFKYVRNFKKHVETHKSTHDGGYHCIHCNKHYIAYHLVRKHVRIFHSARTFECERCDKKFQNVNILQRHKLTHTQVKSYACEVCAKLFGRKDHLRTHMQRTHSGTRASESNSAQSTVESATINNIEPQTTEEQIKTVENKIENTTTLPEKCINYANKTELVTESKIVLNDGTQYLKLSPKKPKTVAAATTSSSSNRRKQTPTKLKALELNAETVTYVALSEMLSPFLVSDRVVNEMAPKNGEEKTLKTAQKVVDDIEVVSKEHKPANDNDDPKTNNTTNTMATTQKPVVNNSQRNKIEDATAADINPLYPFKCHLCANVFFKRRGMLVNHFAKLHPAVDVDQIEVLSAPIVKQQLMYPCPYCSNVYKLNAKRKVHILKHHPGQELPTSMRRQTHTAQQETEVATVGTLTVNVHKCSHCHKQYAARSRLVSHYRKVHPQVDLPAAVSAAAPPTKFDEFLTSTGDNYQHKLMEPEINILPFPLPEQPMTVAVPPVSPENKLLKLSSAALELYRFDFLNERDRCSNDVEASNSFPATGEFHRLPELFEESTIAGIDSNMEKYNRSIEAQFFEKISKFS